MSKDLYTALVREPDAGRPLIFAFHGTGGDEHQLFELANQLAPGAGVIAPRGDVLEYGAARFFRRSSDGEYDLDDLQRARDKMIAFVQAQSADYAEHPTFAFGYSNGANILAAVMCEEPDLFERVALLHPIVTWIPKKEPDLKGHRVFISAGKKDPFTPFQDSERLISAMISHGADVETDLHDGGHELRNSELTALQRFLET